MSSPTVPPPVVIGPDGFLCLRDHPHFAFHGLVNEALSDQAEHWSRDHEAAGTSVKRWSKELGKEQCVALALATFDRAAWIDEHRHELAKPEEWIRRLANVLYHLYALGLPFAPSDMARLIGGRRGTGPRITQIAKYFTRHDLTPELCAALDGCAMPAGRRSKATRDT